MTQDPGIPQPSGQAPTRQAVEETPTAGPQSDWPVARTSSPTSPRKARRRWLDLALGFAAIVAVAGIAFAAGRLTAPTRAAGFGGNFGGGNFGGNLAPGSTPRPGFRGGFGGNFSIEGSVVSVTADQLTIKLASGQTVQIPLDGTTAYHRETAASASDLASGSQVLVRLQPSATSSGGVRSGQQPPASDVTLLSP